MRVTMIGAGYVGLVSGACFADFGHHVTCIDKDPARIAALDRGEIPIFEPGLAELVEANVRQGRLAFAGKAVGVAEADAVMIAVGTPSRRGDGHADLSFVFEAVREIAPLLSRTAIVVTKSTVPVGTGDEIERILREKRPDAEMQVVSNPEFLREGAATADHGAARSRRHGAELRSGRHGAGEAAASRRDLLQQRLRRGGRRRGGGDRR
jgi:UDPglucose 6-dehydrogenase